MELLFLLVSLSVISVVVEATMDNNGSVGSSTRSVDDSVYLHVRRIDYYTGPSQVILECDSYSGDVKFWRELDGLTEQVIVAGDSQGSSRREITLSVTPEMEGAYYCTGGDVRSEPRSLEIVAYPLQDKVAQSIRTLSARLHDNITLPCVFSPGALSSRYSVQWFKSLTEINTQDNSRYFINPEFDLVIFDVNALDVSDAYYCVVHVESSLPRFTEGYHEIGPSIRLMVIDSLSITRPPTHSIISSPTSIASFSCTAFGLPPPSLTWLYRGSKVTATTSQAKIYSPSSNTTMSSRGAMVTRELFITHVTESDSGHVECLVLQESESGDGVMMVMSSSAGLTVIPSSFKPHLLPTSSGVELTVNFPALIPTSFSLNVYYHDNAGSLVGKSQLISPSFVNTGSVEYLIAADELPLATVFSVKVAVSVGHMEGELSVTSNEITVPDLPSPTQSGELCDCSSPDSQTSDSTTQTVLIIFIVLLILLLSVSLGVAIWGVVMVIKRMKQSSQKDYTSERSYSRKGSSYGSRSRSRSRSRSGSNSSYYSRSRSPSVEESYRAEQSKSYTQSNDELGGAKKSVGVSRGREEPEGSLATEDYLALKSAPSPAMTGLGSRANSTGSCVHSNVTSRPLPSTPYEQQHLKSGCHDDDKENEYEELRFKKKKQKMLAESAEGGERDTEREIEEMEREGEGEGVRGRERAAVVEEGDWVVVQELSRKQDRVQELVSTV